MLLRPLDGIHFLLVDQYSGFRLGHQSHSIDRGAAGGWVVAGAHGLRESLTMVQFVGVPQLVMHLRMHSSTEHYFHELYHLRAEYDALQRVDVQVRVYKSGTLSLDQESPFKWRLP